MKVEIEYLIEIPIKVTCSVEKGEPMTRDYPGCPSEIVDLECTYDSDHIPKIIKKEKCLIEEAVWEEVLDMHDAIKEL